MPVRLLLASLFCLLLAAPANAAWFPAEAVDAVSHDVIAVGDLDVARDGSGGLVYLKREGGVPHVFLSRLTDGAWGAPERVDAGIAAGAAQPVLAAGDGGRLAIAWTSGGRLHGAFVPGEAPGEPLSGPQALFGAEAANPDADLAVNGTAYVAFTASGGDVRAVRLRGTGWEAVPAVLDIEPARTAGAGTGRPRVAVSADGNAVVAWGEADLGQPMRVYSRRVTGLNPSVAPQELSLADFEGAAGGQAELPDLDIEDDGSFAWAVFRQDFGGRSRAIARRLVGSLWEAPVAVDGGGPAGDPRIAISGRGSGAATVSNTASGAVQASLLEFDLFGPSYRIDGAGSVADPAPVVAASERDEQAVAWRSADAGGTARVIARYRPARSAFDAEAVLSNPPFGTVAGDGGLAIAESRLGDVAVAFVQAGAQGRAPMVAVWDRPAGRPYPLSHPDRWRTATPTLKWRGMTDLWGPQTFEFSVDGAVVATTTEPEITLSEPLSQGRHTWSVAAIDRRGQVSPMREPRELKVDARRPRVRIRVSGRTVRVVARDRGGSKLKRLRVRWGDGTRTRSGRRAVHVYRPGGRRKLVAKGIDRAGNVTRRQKTIRPR